MILDAHSHVHDPVHGHLTDLDAAGVDRTVLFPTRPHPERASDLAGLRREMSFLDKALSGGAGGVEGYRAAWREQDAALAAHPERFIGFGSVPLGGAYQRGRVGPRSCAVTRRGVPRVIGDEVDFQAAQVVRLLVRRP
ncbi:hypothetical protein ABZY93_25820 [Streptomyces smyrnaeus]|uniref:hypothetical protein n=1 Tax=Streptomyces smyrnaeus TaxID=1387713 RepID=UPI0033B1DCD5